MRVNVVRIGNSRGIRIPKPVLEQCELGEVVELQVRKGHLVVLPVRRTRSGWAGAFQAMAERGDDALLDDEGEGTRTAWDRAEWTW